MRPHRWRRGAPAPAASLPASPKGARRVRGHAASVPGDARLLEAVRGEYHLLAALSSGSVADA